MVRCVGKRESVGTWRRRRRVAGHRGHVVGGDDADAGPGLDGGVAAEEDERLAKAGQEPLGDRGRLAGTGGVLQQHDELVPAQAGRVAWPNGRAQALGDHPEELVAGGVAEAVVRCLEAVQIQQKHGEQVMERGDPGQSMLKRSWNSVRLGRPVTTSRRPPGGAAAAPGACGL